MENNDINKIEEKKEDDLSYIDETLPEEIKEKIRNELTYCSKNPNANEIIPNIFIGNYSFALNKKLLLQNKITHILNCAILCSNFYEKENIFKYLFIPLYDTPKQKLEKYLEISNSFIEEGSSNGNKILIHCGEGQSRSSSLLYMYMIMKKKIIYSDAIKIMKSKRPCVRPNDGFDSQLRQKSYELYNKFLFLIFFCFFLKIIKFKYLKK